MKNFLISLMLSTVPTQQVLQSRLPPRMHPRLLHQGNQGGRGRLAGFATNAPARIHWGSLLRSSKKTFPVGQAAFVAIACSFFKSFESGSATRFLVLFAGHSTSRSFLRGFFSRVVFVLAEQHNEI